MTLIATTSETKAFERLKAEITRSPAQVVIPSARDLQAAMERGDILLHDPLDDGKEKGAFAWISAEPNWTTPTQLYAVHIWGPSERHLDILIDVCQYGVDHGIGGIPISYQRSTHPMTVLADQSASTVKSADGKFSTTTLAAALVSLTKLRDRRDR